MFNILLDIHTGLQKIIATIENKVECRPKSLEQRTEADDGQTGNPQLLQKRTVADDEQTSNPQLLE
jgi:hypothetical protein